MVHFKETIKRGGFLIEYTTIITNNFDEKLILVKLDPRFYMTSYIVYLLTTRPTDYLGLVQRGNLQDTNAWTYIVYP